MNGVCTLKNKPLETKEYIERRLVEPVKFLYFFPKMGLLANYEFFVFSSFHGQKMPERFYNPIRAMGFSAMFTFLLDNTKR